MSRAALPYAAFVGCSLIWGSTFLFIRIGNDSLPPLWACGLRLLLAAAILNGILLARGRRWPTGAALRAAGWYGFWEFGVGMPLLYWGERVVPSGIAAALYASCPVLAMFEARLLGMERLDWRRLGGAFVAFAGIGVIFWREVAAGGSPVGLAVVFAAAVVAPIAGLMLQRGPKQGGIEVNAVGALVGAAPTLLASFALGEPHAMPLAWSQFGPILYLAVAGSTVAFVLFAWLLTQWPTSSAAFIGVIIPVAALFLGALVRHEAFGLGSLLGVAVVLAGVAAALRASRPSSPSEALGG